MAPDRGEGGELFPLLVRRTAEHRADRPLQGGRGEVGGERVQQAPRRLDVVQRAERRLQRSPTARRLARRLVERFWGPVGSGVQPVAETRFIGAYLFGGADGREEARKVDRTIRRLPGFNDVQLLEAWLHRHVPAECPPDAIAPPARQQQDAA